MVGSTLIVTVEEVRAHPPNSEVIVHVSMVVPPIVRPVTAEVSEFRDDADPVPENVDQVPVSDNLGVLAANVPEVVLHKS
jgi:hypothetical protein